MNETQTNGQIEPFKVCAADQQLCWTVTIYAIVFVILTIGGILLNVSLIFITIQTITFRGSVNILLAFYSLCEIGNLSGNFLSIFSAFSGQYFMPFKRAFYSAIVALISASCAVHLLFFIGIERLFVVLFPLKNLKKQIFLPIVFVLFTIQVICCAIYVFISSNCYAAKMNSLEVLGNFYEICGVIFKNNQCSIGELQNEGSIIILCTVIVYALIAVTLHCRKVPSNSNSAHFNNRIFRSLFTIVSVNIGGYLIGICCLIITKSIHNDNSDLLVWHISQFSGILTHISASSNGPILYLTSSEYHDAFQKELSFLKTLFYRSSSVVVPQQ